MGAKPAKTKVVTAVDYCVCVQGRDMPSTSGVLPASATLARARTDIEQRAADLDETEDMIACCRLCIVPRRRTGPAGGQARASMEARGRQCSFPSKNYRGDKVVRSARVHLPAPS